MAKLVNTLLYDYDLAASRPGAGPSHLLNEFVHSTEHCVATQFNFLIYHLLYALTHC